MTVIHNPYPLNSPEWLHREVLIYYHYWPSKALTIIALTLFALGTLGVLISTIVTKRWYMLVAVSVGIMELMGFSFRMVMRTRPVYGYYVAQQCLLIIPPSFLALVEYITLGKVVEAVKLRHPGVKEFLKPKLITWLYFAAEIFSLALQGAGAGLSVSQNGVNQSEKAGKNLLIVGLVLLIVIIVVFLCNAVYVSITPQYGIWRSRNLTLLFTVLYFTTTLLLIRNIFRTIEFAGGWYGSVAIQEKYFYSLDALMILLILFTLSFGHYGYFLNGYEKEENDKSAQGQGLVQMV